MLIIKKLSALIFLMLMAYSESISQKIPLNNPSIWIGYFNRIKLNSKLSIMSDFQIRHIQQDLGIDLKEGRSGLSFQLNKNIGIISGLAFFNQQKTGSNLKKENINEFRLWQEFQSDAQLKLSSLTNRFRVEERFFSNSPFTFFRLRYKIEYDISLSEKIKLLTANELMWQFNKVTNMWDQNRTSIGIERKLNKSLSTQLIFMGWWQFSAKIIQPTVRINLMHKYR